MNDKSNPVGKKFNMLTVLEFSHSDPLQHRIWKCKCECGRETLVATRSLGRQKSCGCYRHLGTYKGIGDIPYDIEQTKECNSRIYGTLYNFMLLAAKRRGLDFTTSIDYLWELYLKQNKKCAISGTDLHFGFGKLGKNRTASLDRIDSSKGYIEGNVQWVHRRINVMKQDMSQEEFLNICKLIVNNMDMEMKHTNQSPVTGKSAGGSPVISAIDYYKRKRPRPRRYKEFKTDGLHSKSSAISEEMEQKIVNLYKDNYTIRAINEYTRINRPRISFILNKHNIIINGSWKSRKTHIE